MSTTVRRFLTPLEFAEEVGISRSLAYELLKESPPRIRYIRVGQEGCKGKYLIFREAVDEFIAACQEEARAESEND